MNIKAWVSKGKRAGIMFIVVCLTAAFSIMLMGCVSATQREDIGKEPETSQGESSANETDSEVQGEIPQQDNDAEDSMLQKLQGFWDNYSERHYLEDGIETVKSHYVKIVGQEAFLFQQTITVNASDGSTLTDYAEGPKNIGLVSISPYSNGYRIVLGDDTQNYTYYWFPESPDQLSQNEDGFMSKLSLVRVEEAPFSVDSSHSRNSAPQGSNTQSSSSDTSTNVETESLNEPFWGVWISASKSESDLQVQAQKAIDKGFHARIIITCDWSNLNPERWYALTVGSYTSEDEAKANLGQAVNAGYKDAYVKYSGYYLGS